MLNIGSKWQDCYLCYKKKKLEFVQSGHTLIDDVSKTLRRKRAQTTPKFGWHYVWIKGYAPLDDVLKDEEGYLDIYNSRAIEDASVPLFPHIPHDVVDVTAMLSFLVCVNTSQDYIPFRHQLLKNDCRYCWELIICPSLSPLAFFSFIYLMSICSTICSSYICMSSGYSGQRLWWHIQLCVHYFLSNCKFFDAQYELVLLRLSHLSYPSPKLLTS